MARAQPTGEVEQVLEQLHALTNEYAAIDDLHLRRIKDIERQIDAAFGSIGKSEGAFCDEPAVGYISTENPDAPHVFAETINLPIVGSWGWFWFFFPVGTTLEQAIAEINAKSQWTGAAASFSASNPNRVEIRSTGYFKYLKINQESGTNPLVFAVPDGGNAMFEWIDYGCVHGLPICATPATLYLSTQANLLTYGLGSTTLIVQGLNGMQMFTFGSGTSQDNIIAAINTFENNIGVTAVQNADNADRVELRSTFLGNDGFVTVMQVGGTPPIILQEPKGGVATYSAFANGVSRLPGDVNCDRIVNAVDLILVVQNWGECPLPPFVCEADLTNDGAVNVSDLLMVMNNWGAVD